MMKEEVELILATVDDAELIHEMKYKAFMPLYEKYHDDETTPVNEKIDKVIYQLTHSNSEYYLIQLGGKNVGAMRVARKRKQNEDNKSCEHDETDYVQGELYISPLFIIPAFQNRGIGQAAIRKVLEIYPDDIIWKLDTIKQEDGNCYFYEKCGFIRVGDERVVNEFMTLVNYEKPIYKET